MTNTVKDICHACLTKSGINFFNYARLYDDGSYYLISNNDDVIEYLFNVEAPLFCPVPLDMVKDKFYFLLPTDGPYQKVIHDVRSHFNIANSFDIFSRHPNYIEACCFSSSASNENIINYYYNHLEVLENFITYFKVNAVDFKPTLKNKLYLPEAMRLNFNSKTAIRDKSMGISHRETDILRLVAKGKTAREIAEVLVISRRTVEHHIENVKHKLNVQTRSELIAVAQQLFSRVSF